MEKMFVIYIIANLLPLISVCGAIYLAAKNQNGWGWLIFLALVSYQTTEISKATI